MVEVRQAERGDVAGCCQGVLLTDHEAWAQGMRVDPDVRGAGVGEALTHAAFDWAAGRGATVMRNLVFSWNDAGLGLSRAAEFEPVTEFRWAHPRPQSRRSRSARTPPPPGPAGSRVAPHAGSEDWGWTSRRPGPWSS